jgi:hypothetical protein
MKMTLTAYDFVNQMTAIRPDNFSRAGLFELFDYLNEIDGDIEFDPIAICCEFTEYENLEAYQNDYGEDCDPDDHMVCAEYDEDQFIVCHI